MNSRINIGKGRRGGGVFGRSYGLAQLALAAALVLVATFGWTESALAKKHAPLFRPHRPRHTPRRPSTPPVVTSVPELDGTLAGAALVLLASTAVLVAQNRRRRAGI